MFYESAIEYVITILITSMEIGLMVFFWYKAMGLKKHFKPVHLVLVSFLYGLIFGILFILQERAPWRAPLTLLISVFIAFIFFDKSIAEKLLNTVIGLIVLTFCGNLVQVIPSVFSTIPSLFDTLTGLILFYLIALPLESVLYLTILHIIKKGRLYLPPKYWIAAIISFSLISACYIMLLIFDVVPETKQQAVLFTAALLGLLLLWFVLYFAFYFVCCYYTKLNEMNLIAMQNEMLEKYVLQKQESDRMIRLLSHDLKHNLLQLKALAGENGDVDMITEYEDMMAMHSMLNVGNDIANAVINEKRRYALCNHIDFQVAGGFSGGLTITRIDFCSLLGNLLDNALEAAEQVEDRSLRKVSLKIGRKDHQLLLFLENDYAVEPELNSGAFISRKKNRGLHGIGTLSVNNIVEKYDGVIENTFHDHIFKSSLMLRCYE